MKAEFKNYVLNFKQPGGTSRGVLRQKETYFLIVQDEGRFGIGECGMFKDLSYDDVSDYMAKGVWVAKNIDLGEETLLSQLQEYPSLQFGVEQAFTSLRAKSPFDLFPSDFLNGKRAIPINGLVWMGSMDFMHQQIQQKLKEGFGCIKMKIGAIAFEKEMDLLKGIRKQYGPQEIELRVDANGAFSPKDVLNKLERLAALKLHSIEQPIAPGQWQQMADLCKKTPLPIALDEELIGITDVTEKEKLLQTIGPQYIILKPSLVGGFGGSSEWINLAEQKNIGWWVTSALESNIGLNAIAQWTATLNNPMPQGLGTGGLFLNNIESPLTVIHGGLNYERSKKWDINFIDKLCI
jgi:o-succinylbenzoate synthase